MADKTVKRKQGAAAIERRKEKRNAKFADERAQKKGNKTGAALNSAPKPVGIPSTNPTAKKRELELEKHQDQQKKEEPVAKKHKAELVSVKDSVKETAKQSQSKPAPSSLSGVVMKVVKLTDDKKAKLLQALSRSKGMTGRPVDTSDKARSTKPAMEPAATTMPRSKSPSQSKVAAAVASENKLTELQEKMKKSLSGGRFRMINEKLYTTTSNVAVELFKDEPETFDIYHEGFRAQVESWPSNPVDQYIKSLSTLRGTKTTRKGDPIVIADMGCGEAALAKSLISLNTDAVTRFRVHSFDLASPNDFVVACDIRHVPLEDDAVDVVVFSLSLMGTNFLDFLREAWRILKMGGQLKIAEVVSRFPDVSKFIAALVEIGFKLVSKNTSNKMFIFFEFTKVVERSEKPKSMKHASDEGGPLLTPCIYKKR